MRRLLFGPAVPPRLLDIVLPVLALAVVSAAPACAEDGGGHLLDSTLEMMNLKTQAGAMPDFVQQSRHDLSQDSYIPAGTKPANRELKMKTPAEVKALTDELDAARTAQIAGKRPKPLSTQASAAAKPAKAGKPLPPAPKTQQATNH